MVRRVVLVGAAALLAISWCSSASAAVVVATFSGVFASGQEQGNPALGEPPGDIERNLAGTPFTVTLTFDNALGTEVPVADQQGKAGAGGTELTGAGPGPNDPLISATFSAFGQTVSLLTSPYLTSSTDNQDRLTLDFDVERLRGGASVANVIVGVFGDSESKVDIESDFMTEFAVSGFGLKDFSYTDDSFSYSDDNPVAGFVSFVVDDQTKPGAAVPFDMFSGLSYFTNVTVTEGPSLTVQPLPEPGSWALMLLGFAGLGGAMRQQRRLPRRA